MTKRDEEDLVIFVVNDASEFSTEVFESEVVEGAFEDGVLDA